MAENASAVILPPPMAPVISTGTAASTDGIDNEAALEGFINQTFGIGTSLHAKAPTVTQGSKLSGQDAFIYAFLQERILKVAGGQISSVVFTMSPVDLLGKQFFTAAEVGATSIVDFDDQGNGAWNPDATAGLPKLIDFDLDKITKALLYDMPYELYWFDKSVGISYSGDLNMTAGYDYDNEEYLIGFSDNTILTFRLFVSTEYSVTKTSGTTDFDTSVAGSIKTAARNAAAIVSQYSGLSDYEKLRAYKDAICDRVSYNDDAADDSTNTPYGNPWQLIWVFDDDVDTKVVCEGYAKAFKYLCDESTFETSVSVSLPTGIMAGGTGEGKHMWNIVTMGNGLNYLVDVTNSDEGTIGHPDYLFMTGYIEKNGNTYTYQGPGDNTISYTYDNDLFLLFTEQELEMSAENFDPDNYMPVNKCGEDLTWALEDGVLTISGTGAMDDFDEENPAPWEANEVTSLVIESGVTSIGTNAFAHCENLTSVTIPGSVLTVPASAFAYCTALTDVTVADGNLNYTVSGGVLYSKDLSELVYYPAGNQDTSFIVPDSVRSIGAFAFCGSTSLEEIYLPSSVTMIGKNAFSGCAALKAVTFHRSVTEIQENAFSDCTSLATVDFQGTEAEAGQISVASGNTSLTSAAWTYLKAGQLAKPLIYDVSLSNGLTVGGEFTARVSIPSGATIVYTEFGRVDEEGEWYDEFASWDVLYASSVNQVSVLGFAMTEPGRYELHAQALRSEYPDDPTELDSEVAVYSFELTAGPIPVMPDITLSATTIDYGDTVTFTVPGAEAVASQTYEADGAWGTNPPQSATSGNSETVSFDGPGDVVLLIWARMNGIWTRGTEKHITVNPLGTFDLPSVTWQGETVDDEITISQYDEKIFEVALPGADGIWAMLQPDTDPEVYNESLLDDILEGSAISLDLTDALGSLGDYLLTLSAEYRQGWVSPERTIRLHVVESTSPFIIENGVITGYTGDDLDLVIPDTVDLQTVTGIGDFAFDGHTLNSVTLPGTLVTLGDGAFLKTGLTEVRVAEGTDTRTWYFYELNSQYEAYLYSVQLPVSVEDADKHAPFLMNRLPGLTPDFVTPSNLTTIEEAAFEGTKPTYVWLTDGVTSIGDGAFAACPDLRFVRVPSSCTSFGDLAFPSGTCLLVDWFGAPAADYAQQHNIDYIILTEGFNG